MLRPPGTHPPPRPRRHVDWELVYCGLHGHHLVGTDARRIRAEDHHIAREVDGLRWHRCLRCDAWVALEPPAQPARELPPDRADIELPLRGKALRDRVVLRLIAVDRAFHFAVLGVLGVAVLLVAAHESSLRTDFYKVLTALQGGVGGGPVQTSGHVGIVGALDHLFSLRSGRLSEVGLGLIGYALLEGIEAVGLWMAKRWAEYLTFIATTVLLPLEIHELLHKLTPLKLIGFVINVAVVLYLIWAKRLFGMRGGGAADEAERAADMNWGAIERATPAGEVPVRAAG